MAAIAIVYRLPAVAGRTVLELSVACCVDIAAWLSVCRVTAIIALVLHVVCLVVFVSLVVCVVCRFVRCAVVQDELCQRVLLYSTPITCVLAGRSPYSSHYVTSRLLDRRLHLGPSNISQFYTHCLSPLRRLGSASLPSLPPLISLERIKPDMIYLEHVDFMYDDVLPVTWCCFSRVTSKLKLLSFCKYCTTKITQNFVSWHNYRQN